MRAFVRAVLPVSLGLMVLAGCGGSHATSSSAPATELAPGRETSAVASLKAVDRSKIPIAKRPPVVHPIRAARPIEELKALPLYEFNETDLDAYLKYLHASEPDPIRRLVHLARKNLGQPYDIYLLGEYPYELYDPDPMYCLDHSDCVTNVENMYAEALSDGWPKFFAVLQRLRYKDGRVGMVTRNHETVADWDVNNRWLFDDVTKQVGASAGEGGWVPLRMTWRPAKFFAKFGIGQDLPDVKVEDAYVPTAKVESILPQLREGDVVQIVRGDPKGEQWVGHLGLVVMGKDGQVDFLHSVEPKVREQSLMSYVGDFKKHKTIGIKILRPKADPQKLADVAVANR
jgi:hypothetical protein